MTGEECPILFCLCPNTGHLCWQTPQSWATLGEHHIILQWNRSQLLVPGCSNREQWDPTMGAGYVLVVMEWVLATRRQVYLCLDACCIVQHGSRLGLPMSIYLLHSYLLQALMRISPHKCLPSRVGQASISFVNHCGEQRDRKSVV